MTTTSTILATLNMFCWW